MLLGSFVKDFDHDEAENHQSDSGTVSIPPLRTRFSTPSRPTSAYTSTIFPEVAEETSPPTLRPSDSFLSTRSSTHARQIPPADEHTSPLHSPRQASTSSIDEMRLWDTPRSPPYNHIQAIPQYASRESGPAIGDDSRLRSSGHYSQGPHHYYTSQQR